MPASAGPGPSQHIPVGAEAGSHDQIAALAYELWTSRGCPAGSPDEDWLAAEERLKTK